MSYTLHLSTVAKFLIAAAEKAEQDQFTITTKDIVEFGVDSIPMSLLDKWFVERIDTFRYRACIKIIEHESADDMSRLVIEIANLNSLQSIASDV